MNKTVEKGFVGKALPCCPVAWPPFGARTGQRRLARVRDECRGSRGRAHRNRPGLLGAFNLPIFADFYRFVGLSWETSPQTDSTPEASERSGSGSLRCLFSCAVPWVRRVSVCARDTSSWFTRWRPEVSSMSSRRCSVLLVLAGCDARFGRPRRPCRSLAMPGESCAPIWVDRGKTR